MQVAAEMAEVVASEATRTPARVLSNGPAFVAARHEVRDALGMP